MSALEAVLAYEATLLGRLPNLLSSEVWLHQADGVDLLTEIARRAYPVKRASLMSDPAPCLELLSGLRVFSRIMSVRRRASLAARLSRSGATPYVTNNDRSYAIYGNKQPRAGWMHASREAIVMRCTVYTDCRRSHALGYACLASQRTETAPASREAKT